LAKTKLKLHARVKKRPFSKEPCPVKGPIISKGLFGILNSSKNEQKISNQPLTMISLEEFDDTNKIFRN
jgi:hypothetical protein